MGDLTFEDALRVIGSAEDHVVKLCGLTLTVNGIALAITDEQFEIVWDAMNEGEDGIPADALFSLAAGSLSAGDEKE